MPHERRLPGAPDGEFEHWHSHEHFPERLALPGFTNTWLVLVAMAVISAETEVKLSRWSCQMLRQGSSQAPAMSRSPTFS